MRLDIWKLCVLNRIFTVQLPKKQLFGLEYPLDLTVRLYWSFKKKYLWVGRGGYHLPYLKWTTNQNYKLVSYLQLCFGWSLASASNQIFSPYEPNTSLVRTFWVHSGCMGFNQERMETCRMHTTYLPIFLLIFLTKKFALFVSTDYLD